MLVRCVDVSMCHENRIAICKDDSTFREYWERKDHLIYLRFAVASYGDDIVFKG